MKSRVSLETRILSELRQKIVDGAFTPGSRLPLRTELQRQYNANPQTVQRALSRLIKDGFVVSRGRAGTFVTEKPPHLNHYGFVFGPDPKDPSIHFQRFLYQLAQQWRDSDTVNFSVYSNMDGRPDNDDYHRLLSDVAAHRLAGLVFDSPLHLMSSPLRDLLDEPHLPCVVISSGAPHPNLLAVDPPLNQVTDRALDYLLAKGRRRVALLATSSGGEWLDHFHQAVLARGLETHAYWMQGVSPHAAAMARNCAHLLMRCTERPDALLILDDSLVEHGTAGLLDAGVRVPAEIEVVAHANFPFVSRSRVPARRVGFDVREVLQTCVDCIDRRRRGEKVTPITEIAPRFEDEVNEWTWARSPIAIAAGSAPALTAG